MLKTIHTPASRPPAVTLRPQLTMSVAFVNRTGRTITVVWRNGQNATLRPMLDTNASGDFTVLVTYTFSNDVNFNSLPQTFDFGDSERRLFEEALVVGTRKGNSLTVAYQIPFVELEGCRGVYHDALDMVVTTKTDEQVPMHPRSSHNQKSAMIPTSPVEMINYRIIVVDKHQTFGRRYVNLGGVVLEAPTIQIDHMPDGIYVAYTAAESADAVRYDLDGDSCPLRFWHSRSEAAAHGDELEVTKQDFEVRKHELKMRELELAVEKGQSETMYKREIQLLETENKRTENLLAERERELDHLRKVKETTHKIREADIKHQYEEQSAVRKNTSEWLKIVPSLLGFAGLAFGMYKSKM